MGKADAATLDISVSDATGQKVSKASAVPADGTVGELISGLVQEMRLPMNDSSGRPLTYHARLEREGRHLNASEVIGDALETNDRIRLMPNVDAGKSSSGAWFNKYARFQN